MKIEAKKSKLSLTKNQAARPGRKPAREPEPGLEDFYAEKKKPKRERIQEPEIREPGAAKSGIKAPRIKIPQIKLPSINLPALKLPRISLPKPGPRKKSGKKSASIAVILAAVPILVVVVWLGLNLRKHAVPAPLFTESNLPPVPPADSNGCAVIYDRQVYQEYSSRDLCDINLFSNAGALENYLDQKRPEYSVPKTLAARDDVKKMMEHYREIITKPVFADMAMPDMRDGQKVRVYLALHNTITAFIITRMQEKKHGAAFRLMKDQLSLNIQYIQSARSMNNYSSAMRAYDKSLNIFKSMLNQFGPEKSMGNEALAASREIGELIRSFNPQAVPLANIVMFEYILSVKQHFNPANKHPEKAVQHMLKPKALVFFDRGLTQKLFNERWKKLYEFAKQPNDRTPEEVRKLQEQRFASGRLWRFHNALGKKYLDSINLPVYNLFQESKNISMAINQKQGEIISLVSALKEPGKQEKKPGKKADKKPAKKIKKRK